MVPMLIKGFSIISNHELMVSSKTILYADATSLSSSAIKIFIFSFFLVAVFLCLKGGGVVTQNPPRSTNTE